MSSQEPQAQAYPSTPPRRRALRLFLGASLVVVVVAGLGLLAAKDLTPRALAKELSGRLGAHVEIQGWNVLARDRFELFGVSIAFSLDTVEGWIHIPTIRISGHPRDLADGIVESLVLEQATVGLYAPEQTFEMPAGNDDPAPIIGLLSARGVDISFCTETTAQECPGAADAVPLSLDLRFTDLGEHPRGTLQLKARPPNPRRDAESIRSTDKPGIDGLALSATLEQGLWAVEAGADALRLSYGGRQWAISDARWRGSLNTTSDAWSTQYLNLEGGLITSDAGRMALPAMQWTAVASGPGESQRLSGTSPLWQTAQIALKTSESELVLDLQTQGVKLDLLSTLVPDLAESTGTLDCTLEVSLPAQPGPPTWRGELVLRPETVILKGEPAPSPWRLPPEASLSLVAEGTGVSGPLSARMRGILKLPEPPVPSFPAPQGAWPMVLQWRADLEGSRLHAEHFDLRAGSTQCTGTAVATLLPGERAAVESTSQWRCQGSNNVINELLPDGMELVGGTWAIRGSSRGSDEKLVTKSRIEIGADTLEWGADRLQEPRASARVETGPGRLSIMESTLEFTHQAHPAPKIHVATKGPIRWRPDRALDGLSLDTSLEVHATLDEETTPVPLGRLQLKGVGFPHGGQADVELNDLDIEAWRRFASPWLPETLASASSKGRARVAGRLTGGEQWRFQGPAELEELGLSDAPGSRVIEGLSAAASLDARWAPSADGFGLEAELVGRSGGFLMLWSTLFSDFSELGTDFKVRLASPGRKPRRNGVTLPPHAAPWRLETRLKPDHGPTIELDADLWPEQSSARVELDVETPDLQHAHQHFLHPLQGDTAFLSSLSGALDLKLQGSVRRHAQDVNWTLDGHLLLTDVDADLKAAQIRDLHLELPISVSREATSRGVDWRGAPATGRLRLGPSKIADIQLPAIESALSIQADSLTPAQPLAIDLLGGTVAMDRFTLKNIARPDRYAETALSLEGIRLDRIAAANDLPPLDGRLDGALPKVTLAGQKLRVTGGGTLQLLGGTVEIRDISGSEIFTPFPKLRLSAELERIDLEQLTGHFDFGKVTGLLSGQIENCELFRGTPTAFEASFRTPDAKGIPKTVDVKAVKNLTILGTGQGTNLFDQGIQRFLSSYRYQALGVQVRLRNDVLLLKGLERRGEKELFLKGAFPFGIDIVNARPGQTVSFQTMVGRLKSLDFGAATVGD